MSPVHSRMMTHRGFTLLELMLVLTLSALAASVVVLRMGSGERSTELMVAAREVASALRYAQGQSLLLKRPVSVLINLDDNSYRISDQSKQFALPATLEISLVVAEEEFAQGEGGIRFFADGSSTGGRVTLESGAQLRRIDVNWITGAVTISDQAA